IIPRSNTLHKKDLLTTRLVSDIGKRSVVVVDPKLGRMRRLAYYRLLTYKQIQPAVVVEIGPGSRLRRPKGKDTAFHRHIGKSPVPIVTQQSLWLHTQIPHPGA